MDVAAIRTRSSRDRHLRVSDRERDDAIEFLVQAVTDGRLTLEEYGDRAGYALTAVTRGDLAVLTYDLGPAVSGHAVPIVDPATGPVERVAAVFGSEIRRGRWSIPALFQARAIFGDCRVELQEAHLTAPVTVIEVRAIFGTVVVLVPDGIDVRVSGSSFLGSRSCHLNRRAPAGAPVLEIRGRAICGEIVVRHPGWKETVRKVIEVTRGLT